MNKEKDLYKYIKIADLDEDTGGEADEVKPHIVKYLALKKKFEDGGDIADVVEVNHPGG